jgi:Domain of unknown function (DUF4394)
MGAVALLALGSSIAMVSDARAELLFGLTSTNSLISFDSATPGASSAPVAIVGLGGETLFDIDIRPANSQLYGLSSAGKLYVINTATGVATFDSSLTGVTLDPAATRFGIDFNPTVDRLRIVSNTGQNLRITPGTGVTTIDSPLNSAATSAVSVAYTNNNPAATTTTLFYINSGNPGNTFNSPTNPNGGLLTLVGPLGVNTASDVGFDISGITGVAYATLNSPTGGGSSLYQVNLATGAATLTVSLAGGGIVRGLAAPVGPIPEASSMFAGLGVLAACGLRRFRRNTATT